jgi:DNA-binding transcriptional LysR family regulator
MDLRQFRYFIHAAKRQNFRRAAEDLRIAQSALTR